MKIETEAEYETCLKLFSALDELHEERLKNNETILKDIVTLSHAIKAYEDIHYPMDKPNLWTRIKFRLAMKYKWLSWLG